MKVNPDKFYLFLNDRNIHHVIIYIEKLSSACCEKLFGIKIDNELSFEDHIERLCKIASKKV